MKPTSRPHPPHHRHPFFLPPSTLLQFHLVTRVRSPRRSASKTPCSRRTTACSRPTQTASWHCSCSPRSYSSASSGKSPRSSSTASIPVSCCKKTRRYRYHYRGSKIIQKRLTISRTETNLNAVEGTRHRQQIYLRKLFPMSYYLLSIATAVAVEMTTFEKVFGVGAPESMHGQHHLQRNNFMV